MQMLLSHISVGKKVQSGSHWAKIKMWAVLLGAPEEILFPDLFQLLKAALTPWPTAPSPPPGSRIGWGWVSPRLPPLVFTASSITSPSLTLTLTLLPPSLVTFNTFVITSITPDHLDNPGNLSTLKSAEYQS